MVLKVFEPFKFYCINRKRGSIAHSLSLPSVHRPDMTETLLKRTYKRKSPTHPLLYNATILLTGELIMLQVTVYLSGHGSEKMVTYGISAWVIGAWEVWEGLITNRGASIPPPPPHRHAERIFYSSAKPFLFISHPPLLPFCENILTLQSYFCSFLHSGHIPSAIYMLLVNSIFA